MAEYTTLEQVKIRLKQFHIDSKSDSESSKVVFDHFEENPLLEQLISQAEADIRAKRMYPESYTEEKIAADMKNFSPLWLILSCMTDRKPVKTSWQAIQKWCVENMERPGRTVCGCFPFAKVL